MSLAATAFSARERLLQELDSGVHAPGGRLPGERELAARLQVSRGTLRAALASLEEQGRLMRSAQRGWFVPAEMVGEPPSTLQSFTEMARSRGLRPTAVVHRQEVGAATFDEAQKLRIAPTSPVFRIDRLRGLDGRPVCFDVVVVAAERAPGLIDVDLTDVSLYDTLKEVSGVTVHRSAYSVMAANADAPLARLLDTTVGAAILVGEEVAYTQEGIPILMGTNRYRGDAYRFQADLFRRAEPN